VSVVCVCVWRVADVCDVCGVCVVYVFGGCVCVGVCGCDMCVCVVMWFPFCGDEGGGVADVCCECVVLLC